MLWRLISDSVNWQFPAVLQLQACRHINLETTHIHTHTHTHTHIFEVLFLSRLASLPLWGIHSPASPGCGLKGNSAKIQPLIFQVKVENKAVEVTPHWHYRMSVQHCGQKTGTFVLRPSGCWEILPFIFLLLVVIRDSAVWAAGSCSEAKANKSLQIIQSTPMYCMILVEEMPRWVKYSAEVVRKTGNRLL